MPATDVMSFSVPRVVIDGARRLAALVCLVSVYKAAGTPLDGRWLIVSVVAALIVATGPAHWHSEPADPRPLPWLQRPVLRQLLPGWLLMMLSAGCNVVSLPSVGIVLWLIGFVWLLWSARQLSKQFCPEPRQTPAAVWRWCLVALAVAATLRLWEIDSVPRYVHCDEGNTAILGLQFYNNPPREWFGAMSAGSNTTMNLCFAAAGFGAWLGGFNPAAARMPDVILGTLSVVLLLDGLWRVSSVPVAVVSALLLAANHDHLGFSRIASGYIQTAFVVSLLFAVLARVWTAPSYLNSVVLGVAAALGVQTYRASMIALPLLLGVILLLALLHPKRRRAWATPFVIFAVSGLAAGAPAAVTLWQQRALLLLRSNEINIFVPSKMEQLKREVYHTDSAAQVVAQQAWNSLRGFYLPLNAQPQYGSITYGMADPYSAALMIPGAVLALLGIRRFVAPTALVFTVVYLLLGLGMEWAPGFNRATGALPLGMVFPAIAAVQCCATLWGNGPRGRWAQYATLAAVVTLCGVTNIWIYFVHNRMVRDFGDEISEAAWVARQYAGAYTVYLVEQQQPGGEGLRLILGGLSDSARSRVHLFPHDANKMAELAKIEPSGADLFVIDVSDPAARDAVVQRFPQAREEIWRRDPKVGPAFFLLFVGLPRATSAG